MAGTEYTEKQIKEFEAQRQLDGTLPDGAFYDPAAFARGGPIYRKMTAEDRRNEGLPPATASADAKDKED